jgi:hypothetical protein
MSAEADLYAELRDLYRKWKEDYRYNANRFVQKLEKDGAVKTVTDLVLREGESKGFQELRARGLLHLTVEAMVIRPEYSPLFSADVLTAAEEKLRAAGATFLNKH